MSKGRHAKDSGAWKKVTLVAGVATTGAIPLSIVSAPTAQAAPISSWDRIAECESNQRWNLPYGDNGRSSGGLQFQPASWNDALAHLRSKGVDTSGFPQGPGHQAYKATKQQQILAGEALLDLQGPGAWVCNGLTGYPLSSSGPNSSMFNGGVKPYADGGTAAPKPPSTPSTGGTYKVVPGDSLYLIARAKLGDGEKWPSIYALNKGVVGSNPNLIFPGQVLKLPGDTSKPAPAPSTPSASHVKPVNAKISQSFHNPGGHYTLGYHTGVDFSAASGTPTVAACAGTVVSSDTSSSYGNNVQIKTNDGRYLLYAHLSSKAVYPGQTVKAGQTVGAVGNTGTNSSGPHLHLEVRTAPNFAAGNFLDPLSWLKANGVIY